jgi:hypothetical protein
VPPGNPPKDEPRLHPWVWLVYAVLLAIAIPWYFPAGNGVPEPIWLGFPRWVTVSFGATVAIALFTAFVIGRYWDEDENE